MENIVQGQWFRGPSADLGSPISQSLRLRGNQCLHHTFSRSSTGNTATLSFWVKIADVDREHCFIINKNGNHRIINVNTNNVWCFNAAGGNFQNYDAHLVRDQAAWYHVLVIQNNGTTSLYINGSQVGSSSTGVSGFWNSTGNNQLIIGAETDAGGGSTSECYLAEYNLLDGTAIGVTNGVPDEFGRFNEDGVWVPKSVSGLTSDQYGADGFRLVFDNAEGIGDDSAPTGGNHASANDFTTVGFETTAISSSNFDNDVDFDDTPTNNHATINGVNLLGNGHVKSANLTVHATGSGITDISSSIPASLFNCYFEVNNKVGSGLRGIGIGDYRARISQGTSSYVTYRENGSIRKFPGDTSLGTESSYTTDDVIGVAVTSTQISFYKNGTLEGTYTHGLTGDFYAIGMAHYYNSGSAELDFNFGQMPFRHTVPTGFKALNSNNLAEPTIKDSSQHFDILTYTGNGTNRTLSGLNFQPDFTWIKNRASGHYVLQDSVRGASKQLFCDVTQAEQTNATNFVTSFTSNGFTSGPSAQGSGDTNSNNSAFVAYCWKGGGTAVSNTDGSITSSVSANTDAGFSIVTYTGTGANATVGHGLNSAPECVLIKDRENGNYHWQMWHTGLSSDDHSLLFNDTAAESDYNSWQNTAPTNTVVSLGQANGVNAANDHVMYCWHSVEGYSKFGEYEANNDSNGPFIWCGFKPRWLLIKKIGGTAQWRLWDSARDTRNPRETLLFPDSSEAEASHASYHVDFVSNGFKIRNGHAAINTSGGHIFMAFAEKPFGGNNAAPLTAV